ncbi:DNA methylase [compost metagenome]
MLENAPLPKKATVLDPWNGSGTTTYIADQLGHQALGYDVNPVAAIVANAKLARPQDARHVLGLAMQIVEASLASTKGLAPKASDPLLEWLRPAVVSQYRAIETAVLAALATDRSGVVQLPRMGELPPLASFLILALMRSARSLAGLPSKSNPTWIVPGKARGTRALLSELWLSTLEQMAEDLSGSGSSGQLGSQVQMADARKLPLPDSSVDFVLTSPPYCTRIDYVVSTSFELAALGVDRKSGDFLSLRQNSMGSPLTTKGPPPELRSDWPEAVRCLLEAIRSHYSKASSTYYYKTYWQYFNDCYEAIRDLHRVLRPRASAVLVVQSSYYKDLLVDLPRLYVSMGETLGFKAEVVSEVEVRRALAQINTRSLRYHSRPNYTEAVVLLEKRDA